MRRILDRHLYKLVLLFAISAFAVLIVLYRLNFDGELSPSRAVWGQFGDFIGGTLNPILGFVTIIILISTLKVQREELKEARMAIKDNNRLISSQLALVKQQSLENTFFRLLDDFNNDAAVKMSQGGEYPFAVFFACYKVQGYEVDSQEAADLFYSVSGGLHIGQFRYVVIEKFAALVNLANELENGDIHLKILHTTAGLLLVSSIFHHSLEIDEGLYHELIAGKEIVRGIGKRLIFSDRVAEDILDANDLTKYLSVKGQQEAELQEAIRSYLAERDSK